MHETSKGPRIPEVSEAAKKTLSDAALTAFAARDHEVFDHINGRKPQAPFDAEFDILQVAID